MSAPASVQNQRIPVDTRNTEILRLFNEYDHLRDVYGIGAITTRNLKSQHLHGVFQGKLSPEHMIYIDRMMTPYNVLRQIEHLMGINPRSDLTNVQALDSILQNHLHSSQQKTYYLYDLVDRMQTYTINLLRDGIAKLQEELAKQKRRLEEQREANAKRTKNFGFEPMDDDRFSW